MVKFSKLGAAALALALTVTFVAPTPVNAGYYYDKNGSGTATYDEKTNTYTTYAEDGEKAVYTNKVTKATYTGEEDDSKKEYKAATKYDPGFIKKYDLGVDGYKDIDFDFEVGEKLTSLKAKSGKGNTTIKQVGKKEVTDYPDYDNEKKQFYFWARNGEDKIYVGAAGDEDTEANRVALKNTAVSYTYRFFGKKTGTTKYELKYTDITGKAVTKKFSVRVVTDSRIVLSATYAGKQLVRDYSKKGSNANHIDSQTENKRGIEYTTKKSGKFKVKLNKNYKWVATYVVKPTDYVTVTSEDSNEYGWKETSSSIQRKRTKGIDLNGDGDTFDIINGIREDGYGYYFEDCVATSVKNGKTIKLNTVPDKTDSKYTEEWKGASSTFSRSSTETSSGNIATTTILVAFQDKVTKEFSYTSFDIKLRVKK